MKQDGENLNFFRDGSYQSIGPRGDGLAEAAKTADEPGDGLSGWAAEWMAKGSKGLRRNGILVHPIQES